MYPGLTLYKPNQLILQRNHPLALGLIAAYPFGTGAGLTLYDVGGYSLNGNLLGNMGASPPSWVAGKFGTCLSFTTNTYVDFGTSINVPKNLSVVAWINTTQNTAVQHIFSDSDSGGTLAQLRFFMGSTGKLDMSWDNSLQITGVKTVTTNTWHQVACTRWGGVRWNGVTYIDGAQDNFINNSATVPTSTPTDFTLGRLGAQSSNYFKGSIDNLLIYNRALTAGEIFWLFNEPWAIYTPQKKFFGVATTAVAVDSLEWNSASLNIANFKKSPPVSSFVDFGMNIPAALNPSQGFGASNFVYRIPRWIL